MSLCFSHSLCLSYHLFFFLDVSFSVRFWVTGLRLGGLSQTHWHWSRSRRVFPKRKALSLECFKCFGDTWTRLWVFLLNYKSDNNVASIGFPLCNVDHTDTHKVLKDYFGFVRNTPFPFLIKFKVDYMNNIVGAIKYDDFLPRHTHANFIHLFIFCLNSIIYE